MAASKINLVQFFIDKIWHFLQLNFYILVIKKMELGPDSMNMYPKHWFEDKIKYF